MATGTEKFPRTGAVPLISTGKKRPFWTVLKRCVQIAASVDLMFFIIFYAAGSPVLAWINVISILIYAAAYACLTYRWNIIAVCLIWTEVLGHAALGTVMVGWGSGFHYYLLMFIPAIFVSTRTFNAVVAVFVLWCFYVGLDAVMHVISPMEPLVPQALAALRYFNISVVFAMFAYLSSYYYRTIVETQDRLSKLAMTDHLTGLYNRRHIMNVIDYEAVRQKRSTVPLSLIIADIDHFKSINDKHGHETGDAMLVAVSQTIRASIREQDSASRWGGEEFLIVLPDTELDDAIAIAQRIREKILATTVAVEKQTVSTSVTLGVSSHANGETVRNAIARADELLYRGKKAGRNRVVSELSAGQ
jgi:diguanylate cyclase